MSEPGKKRDGRLDLPDLSTLPPDGGERFNRLIFSTSPYLLQHAQNPVDWFPWGPEAFEKAAREDKPVFLSIGYSTCHWCHVMAHESFEDEETARFLNEHYVSVKVDREERPDIDHVYMEVCQAMTGGGGWPMTIIMTPEKKPFFAGTYFPKYGRFGHAGLLDILSQVIDIWNNDRARINQTSEQVVNSFRGTPDPKRKQVSPALLDQAVFLFRSGYDELFGGFSHEPKFPMGHVLGFLLRMERRKPDPSLLAQIEHTLKEMSRGGIFDRLGYGFCRYSVDKKWLVPHFEKMLYDNALLIMAYADAFQRTRDEQYSNVVQEIVAYVRRELTSPDGTFFCAENADSEGEEGKFYVFSHEEFLSVLGPENGSLAAELFGVTPAGNFEEGKNILHLPVSLDVFARRKNLPLDRIQSLHDESRRMLLEYREKRVHPSLDDKILVSWNGLMIAALAHASQALHEPEYARLARRSADVLLSRMSRADGRLMHGSRQGKPGENGFLDDYAFLVWGLINLYESTFNPEYLRQAIRLNDLMIEDFQDSEGGFFLTAATAEPLFVRPKDGFDGAIPSGNSVAALNLVRLARMTGTPEYEGLAQKTISAFSSLLNKASTGFSMMLTAFDFALGPSCEIVLAGPDRGSVAVFEKILHESFMPWKVVLFSPDGPAGEDIRSVVPLLSGKSSINGKGTVYICKNNQCHAPISDPKQFEAWITSAGISG